MNLENGNYQFERLAREGKKIIERKG